MSSKGRPAFAPKLAHQPVVRRGIDRFDMVVILLLLLTFVGVAVLPFAPKKYGDLVFHREAKAFAAATLPTVRSHLKAIIAIASDMGIGV